MPPMQRCPLVLPGREPNSADALTGPLASVGGARNWTVWHRAGLTFRALPTPPGLVPRRIGSPRGRSTEIFPRSRDAWSSACLDLLQRVQSVPTTAAGARSPEQVSKRALVRTSPSARRRILRQQVLPTVTNLLKEWKMLYSRSRTFGAIA